MRPRSATSVRGLIVPWHGLKIALFTLEGLIDFLIRQVEIRNKVAHWYWPTGREEERLESKV